jgi:hypothetical protein
VSVSSSSSSSAEQKNVGKFIIYFPEMFYEIVEEKESYDLVAFLCDVGGTFGLFLGCSVLTCVEVLELFWAFFVGKGKKEEEKKKKVHY